MKNNGIEILTEKETKTISGGTNLGFLFGVYVGLVAATNPATLVYSQAYYSYEVYKKLTE